MTDTHTTSSGSVVRTLLRADAALLAVVAAVVAVAGSGGWALVAAVVGADLLALSFVPSRWVRRTRRSLRVA